MTAVTQSIWVFVSLSISLATSLKVGEILPRTLNYFWKQNDLCPTEDLEDWSSPTTITIFVSIILSHGLRGKLWFLCHRSPPSYLVPGSVDPLVDSPLYRLDLAYVECFPFPLPAVHSGTTTFLGSEICLPLVLCSYSPLSLLFSEPLLFPLFHL